MTLNPQFITDARGKRKSVILTIKEYENLIEQLEDAEDVRLYDEVKARNEPTIPFEDYLKAFEARKNG